MIYKFDSFWSYITNESREVIDEVKKLLNKSEYDYKREVWNTTSFWVTHSNILNIETIKFPTGLCDLIHNKLGIEIDYKKSEKTPHSLQEVLEIANKVKSINPHFEVRDYQTQMALIPCDRYQSFIVSSTSSGKTSTMTLTALLMKDKKILVMNNQNFILKQIYERFLDMGIPKEEIGTGVTDLSKRIVIISAQTSYNKIKEQNEDYLNYLKTVEVLINDECQHFQSLSHFSVLFFMPNLQHLIGYTGSPYKSPKDPYKNIDDTMTIGLFGEPAVEFTLQDSIDGNNVAQPYSYFVKYDAYPIEYSKDTPFYIQYKRSIVYNKSRNRSGTEIVKYLNKRGIKTLVLFRDIKNHGFKIMKELAQNNIKCLFLQGGEKIHEYDSNLKLTTRKGTTDDIKLALNGDYNIVLASQVMDEGVDISLFQAGVLFTGGQSAIKIIQQTGRVARKKQGKENIALMVDFDDSKVNSVMDRHYKTRRRTLNNNGVIELPSVHHLFDIIDKMSE